MCDYSLESYKHRPAAVGERVQLNKFPSGSSGFADPQDPNTAVCVLPGNKLELEGISRQVQKSHAVGPSETVIMIRKEGSTYHDAVRFRNGKELFLGELIGVTATVLPETPDLEKLFKLNELPAPAPKPAKKLGTLVTMAVAIMMAFIN